MKTLTVLVLLCCSGLAWGGDEDTASALTAGALKLLASGKTEKSKELLFQALVYGPNPTARFTLGKLLATEGDKQGGELLFAVYSELAETQRPECLRLLQLVNPAGAKILLAFKDYQAELKPLELRAKTEEITAEELNVRYVMLGLKSVPVKGRVIPGSGKTETLLIESSWQLDWGTGQRALKFEKDGKLANSTKFSESSWRLVNGKLELIHDDTVVRARLTWSAEKNEWSRAPEDMTIGDMTAARPYRVVKK